MSRGSLRRAGCVLWDASRMAAADGCQAAGRTTADRRPLTGPTAKQGSSARVQAPPSYPHACVRDERGPVGGQHDIVLDEDADRSIDKRRGVTRAGPR